MRAKLTRRAAILGGAALLPGCSVLDPILGERKVPLPGERRSVLTPEPPVRADEAARPVSLPPAEPVAEWPQAGGNAAHDPGHVALPEGLAQAWRASAGSGSGSRARITAGPVAAGGTVYTVDAYGTVSAFALDTGARRWTTETTRDDETAGASGGGAALVGGVLYVSTGLAEVLALSPADGAIRWRTRLPSPSRGAPTVAGGRIFVPTLENHLIALSVEDGRRLWTHRGQPLVTLPLGLPAPAVEGETVVAAFASGELTALRAADGRVLWSETVAASGAASLADIVGITGLPVVSRGRAFAVGVGGTSIAVDVRSGRRLWERGFGGGNGFAAVGDWLFAVTGAGDALAIGRDDGRIRWVRELNPTPEGGRRRRREVRFGPPLVAGGRVLVPASNAELLVLDPADGGIAGRVSLSSGSTLPAAVAGGTLLLLGDDGTLMALRG